MLILCLSMHTRISRRLSQRAGVTRRKLANEAEPTIPSAPGAPRNRNHRCAPVPWSSSDSSTLGAAEGRLTAAVRLQVPGPRIKAQWTVRRPRHRQGRNIPVQLKGNFSSAVKGGPAAPRLRRKTKLKNCTDQQPPTCLRKPHLLAQGQAGETVAHEGRHQAGPGTDSMAKRATMKS